MSRLSLLLLIFSLAWSTQAEEGVPGPIDIEADIRRMLESSQEEPPLLSGEDAPPLEGEVPATEPPALPAVEPPAAEPPAQSVHLPLPEKTITIEGLDGVDALQREIDAARRRQHDDEAAPAR